MILVKKFTFDAAHNLINYDGKCKNLHGHTYHLAVKLTGNPDPETGMLLDFGELKKIVEENVLNKLDHGYINDVIEQPTAENISEWIYNKLREPLNLPNCHLCAIELWETPDSYVIYDGK